MKHVFILSHKVVSLLDLDDEPMSQAGAESTAAPMDICVDGDIVDGN